MAVADRINLIECIEVSNELGECVLWRALDQTIWWTDITECRLYRLTWPGLVLSVFPTPERVGSFAFIEENTEKILVALATGFAFFTPKTGHVDWLSRPAELSQGIRLNDGRVDPMGRFWAGSMREHNNIDPDNAQVGLYRVGQNLAADFVYGGLNISNGICWSSDEKTMYFADSSAQEIYQCPYDIVSGSLGSVSVLAKIESGHPDGAVTDVDGRIWSAIWGGAQLLCLSGNGKILSQIDLPILQPTCPAFGGPNNDLLFVSSARQGLTSPELEKYPKSGSLMIFESSIKGVGNFEFRV